MLFKKFNYFNNNMKIIYSFLDIMAIILMLFYFFSDSCILTLIEILKQRWGNFAFMEIVFDTIDYYIIYL